VSGITKLTGADEDVRRRAATPSVLADTWYSGGLPLPTLDDGLVRGWVARVARANAVARGVALWWCGRRHELVVLDGWGTAFKTFILLERMLGRGRRYLVLLQFLFVPEECWEAAGRRSRLRARLRVAGQQHIMAPVLRRALARAHVLSSWEPRRNADEFGLDTSRFAFLPWPLVIAGDECPRYVRRGRRVLASGRTLCDWPTVFAAARDQDWDLEVLCSAEDRPLVDRLNRDRVARVRCDIPVGEYRELVREAAVHIVAQRDCPASSGHLRVMDTVRAGTPLVASAVPGLVDYVDPGATALVFPPGDFLAARNSVNRLLADRGLCERLRSAAFERARGWTREQYMAGIAALIEGARPSGDEAC
jgi:hypothetical protein